MGERGAFVGVGLPRRDHSLGHEVRDWLLQDLDPRFAERLASELGALGVQLDDDLFFICRSGSRSLAAAKAMAAAGYRACHNVAGGFEGPLDDERHRGSAEGWKAAGLPWLQG
jgi:rhodanese-related sulfurtransferase